MTCRARVGGPRGVAAVALLAGLVLPGLGCQPAKSVAPAPPAAAAKTSWGEAPVVRVGDGVVTREAVERRFAARRREAERLGQPVPPRAEVLEEIVQQELLVQQALREGVLASDADLRDRVIERLFAKRQREQRLPTPSSAELRAFFEEHRQLFPEDERVKLRHLLLEVPPGAAPADEEKVRRRAEELRRQAAARPAGFGDLARAHSADPSAKLGGDTGYLPAGRWAVVFGDEITRVLPSLKAGEIGPLVRSRRGFHVIQLVERTAVGADPLQTRQQEILSQYRRQAAERQRAALVAEVRRQLPVVPLAPLEAPGAPAVPAPSAPAGAGSGTPAGAAPGAAARAAPAAAPASAPAPTPRGR